MPEEPETQAEKPKRQARKPRAAKKPTAPKPAEKAPDAAEEAAEKPKPAATRKPAAKKTSRAKAKSQAKPKVGPEEKADPPKPAAGVADCGARGPEQPSDSLSAIVADAEEIFRFDPVKGHQDRAHEYLARRKVDRGSDDTATEVAVVDLVERAFKAGMLSSGQPLPGLDRLAARLARVGSELIEQSAELLASGSRR